jgi:hypothetical protein
MSAIKKKPITALEQQEGDLCPSKELVRTCPLQILVCKIVNSQALDAGHGVAGFNVCPVQFLFSLSELFFLYYSTPPTESLNLGI